MSDPRSVPDRAAPHDGRTDASPSSDDASHAPPLDLSDTPAHARHPEDYTETPGSHRRTPDGPALDVGG